MQLTYKEILKLKGKYLLDTRDNVVKPVYSSTKNRVKVGESTTLTDIFFNHYQQFYELAEDQRARTFAYFEFEELNGEYEYTHRLVRYVDSFDLNKVGEEIASAFYGGEPEEEDDGYMFDEVFVKLSRVQEITKEEFEVLNKFL